MTYFTSIILLSYNTYPYTKACIESIRRHTEPGTYEIIVIDNASQDESVDWLKEQTDCILICNRENVGFPKGCNQGMEIAKGSEILLLNNDVIVTPGWLVQLRQALYSSPMVGAVSCMSNSCSNFQQVDASYDTLEELDTFAKDYHSHNALHWIPWMILVGFCFLLKREVFHKIGYMDEQFSPGNYEDNDYSFRVWVAGYQLLLCKDTFIHHFGSVSFKKRDAASQQRYFDLLQRNRNKFLQKWKLTDSFDVFHSQIDMLWKNENPKHILLLDCDCGADLFYWNDREPESEFSGVTRSKTGYEILKNVFHMGHASYPMELAEAIENSYDIILLLTPLEELSIPQEPFLAQIRRHLRPNGKFFYLRKDKLLTLQAPGNGGARPC